MSERKDFEVQRRARSDEEPQRVEQRSEDGEHDKSVSKNGGNLKGRNRYGVSGRDSPRKWGSEANLHSNQNGALTALQGGIAWRCQGRKPSSCLATERIIRSPPAAATSCMESGNPLECTPEGTTAAG
jgi:hypothetical protein